MKFIHFFGAFLCLILFNHSLFAQCNLTVLPAVDDVHCGDTLVLNAYVNSTNAGFDNGTLPAGWQSSQGHLFTNPCTPGNGSTHYWMGDLPPLPRFLTSPSIDFSTPSTICFDLRYSVQADLEPCEGPDEPNEGVYLQYSTDGGNNWFNIHYFDPLGGYDPVLTAWNSYCFSLPQAALTPNTTIRWFQDMASDFEYDHWGLDNISILVSDTTYTVSWLPSGTIGNIDTIVVDNSTSVVNVSATNGTESCSTDINLNVIPVDLILSAGVDTVVCADSCIILSGEAYVLVEDTQSVVYANNTPASLVFGTDSIVSEILVSGMSMSTLSQGSIVSVCIDAMYNGNFSDISFHLISPNLTQLELFPLGALSGTSSFFSFNFCFTTSASQAIDNSGPPYSGNYLPANGNSLNDLAGSSVTGTWKLRMGFSNSSSFAFINSWNITFLDDANTRAVGYSWSPSSTLNDPLLLNPLACPTDTTVYHLVINDPLGCVSGSDSVRIAVDPNCIVSVLELEEGLKAFIPTAFTPNGDGLNDTFYPQGLGLGDYELLIYDRYNNLVFTSESGSKEWDGRNVRSNKEVPQGMYIWQLRIKDKTSGYKEYTGKVSVLK